MFEKRIAEEQNKENSENQIVWQENRVGKMETKSNISGSDINAKWDACIDLTARRFVYSSLSGAFAGLLFFRSPATRWASIAFGAGIGIGSAYTDCSRIFDASTSSTSTTILAPKSTETSVSQTAEE